MLHFSKTRVLAALAAVTMYGPAMSQPSVQNILGGFYYGKAEAPAGHEWQSPDSLAYNKQLPHAYFFSFASTDAARKVLPYNMPSSQVYWQSLNGSWKFHWVKQPSERPVDFYRTDYATLPADGWTDVTVPMNWNVVGINHQNGEQRWGAPIYTNIRAMFQHKYAVDDWRGGVMRTPPADWLVARYPNEVGSYRRTFTLPDSWKGREVYLQFDGVDSFFYLWVNGHYVGFSKNSRNMAEFDVTPYLDPKSKEQLVAVEVYRLSDGSMLEDQDMFRLAGIFRDVAVVSRPTISVRDLKVIPTADNTLNITATVQNLTRKSAKDLSLRYTLYANELYSDRNFLVDDAKATSAVPSIGANSETLSETTLVPASEVRQWSAEAPYRYTLVAQLVDKKGRVVETISTTTGFRHIEIRETKADDDEYHMAGRYYYLNGQPIKMKGVNRHENAPATGHYVTRKQMEHEVMLMKQGNINHVRCSHYPDAPYWYYLCDKYGIYLENEANVESHQYGYDKASLSHPIEWRNAHIARNMEMVHATINNPSVCIWSLGNEAGPGDNFKACYEAIRSYDLSRPVQYERNNNIVDMGSNQYPTPAWVKSAATGKEHIKYPFHISEYAHSMGNAVGNLIDIWEGIESSNFVMGGAIWDWVDQAIDNYTATGERYWGYGGDFGDKPNDGMFCMNGIMRPDLTPKAQYYEVKKVYQNVGVSPIDIANGRIEIFNKNYFTTLADYDIRWSLWRDGECILKNQPLQGPRRIVGPREKQEYTLAFDKNTLDAESEYYVKVQFLLGSDMPWAKRGYVQMEEQLPVQTPTTPLTVGKGNLSLTVSETSADLTIASREGNAFSFVIDKSDASVKALTYHGEATLLPGSVKLDAYRAPVDNDIWVRDRWMQLGLCDLRHRCTSLKAHPQPTGEVIVIAEVESQAPSAYRNTYNNRDRNPSDAHSPEAVGNPFGPNDFKFKQTIVWTIMTDGVVEMHASITSNNASAILPHIGYAIDLPTDFNRADYYGRGPIESYNDRRTSQFIEHHAFRVGNDEIMLPKPQDMGNREDTRWLSITNGKQRLSFIPDGVMAFSALPWTQLELSGAAHPYELPKPTATHILLKAMTTGLGGNSCGQSAPLAYDRVKATARTFGFRICRSTAIMALPKIKGKPALTGLRPITIDRDALGNVTISSADKSRKILYKTTAAAKAQTYTEPFELRHGGTVTAWFADNQTSKTASTFERLESTPLEVLYCSSEEYGETASNLLDGDQSTIWHTAYSVTLAKYPHVIDFDALKEQTMKGFVITGRSNGTNGRIKDFEVCVSSDGKNWGSPILSGTLKNNDQPQRITFTQPVKARYLRFRALSEQNGNEFASAAEFQIIVE